MTIQSLIRASIFFLMVDEKSLESSTDKIYFINLTHIITAPTKVFAIIFTKEVNKL